MTAAENVDPMSRVLVIAAVVPHRGHPSGADDSGVFLLGSAHLVDLAPAPGAVVNTTWSDASYLNRAIIDNSNTENENMKTKPHNGSLETWTVGIAKSREDMAALAASLQGLSQWQPDAPPVVGDEAVEEADHGDGIHGKWMNFRHGVDVASTQSIKVARRLSDEIDRHPMVSGVAAFGIGFGIATLLFKRGRGDSSR